MEILRTRLIVTIGVLVTGCGSSDSKGEPNLCEEIQAKHDECDTGMQILDDCDMSSLSPELECGMRQCTLAMECDEVRAYLETMFMSTEQLNCYEQECNVVFSGQFNCADGSGAVPTQARCDGEAGCPDGSDETGCP